MNGNGSELEAVEDMSIQAIERRHPELAKRVYSQLEFVRKVWPDASVEDRCAAREFIDRLAAAGYRIVDDEHPDASA